MKRRWLRRAASSAVAAVILFAIVIFAVAATRAQLVAPPPTTLLLDRQGRYLADVGAHGDGGLGYWPLPGVPERVAAATIAIEDQRFFEHSGVDLLAIARAFHQNTSSGRRISGASTLAMQIARMQRPGDRTYLNKILEAATALVLTARYGRDAILEHYLRIAPYANQIHGIAHAAERYFGKPVEDLSWAEIAFLAALPQSPSRMNPHDWRGYARAKKRAERILALLREREVTSNAEHSLALAELEQIAIRAKPRRSMLALHVILRIEELLEKEPDHPLRLVTSIDLELQERAVFAAEQTAAGLKHAGAGNAAVIVVERETRAVLAYVGSTGYFESSAAGAIDFARTPRAAGSTLKPFIFAAALERGVISPNTILDDLSRGPTGIANMDGNYLGPMLPRAALGNSRNIPAARLVEELGVQHTYDVFGDLGLHKRELPASHYGAGMAIGSLPVTLEGLVAGYATLANDGTASRLMYWENAGAQKKKIFSENTARQITLFLADPLARLPTFPRLGPTEYSFPVAIKTGTSQGFRDAWTVAYSAQYIVGAWIGRPDARPMHGLTGTRGSAVLVRKLLEPLHAADAQGLRDLSFAPPAETQAVRVCALSGKRATAACDHVFVEHLEPGAIEDCPVHVEGLVDGEKRTFVELAPKYARWAAEQYFVSAPASRKSASISDELAPPKIVQPENGSVILIDPETPADAATLALEAQVDRSVPELLWYVDGKPFQLTAAPFHTRWPLARGVHTIEARIPYTPYRSAPIEIRVE